MHYRRLARKVFSGELGSSIAETAVQSSNPRKSQGLMNHDQLGLLVSESPRDTSCDIGNTTCEPESIPSPLGFIALGHGELNL